uniref:DSBA-like thioredoxin domain-containing protein n=1 Tax=Rhodosorus marinus TaxID=101924 RepID=A0A7S0G499_9RHOD|mmetsp:Transcript_22421/g.32300  ORF Transcript_22421/g.32300 Transcript_22421/m.32300 type:complete len:251 (+) Transcript_22421:90-842(+)
MTFGSLAFVSGVLGGRGSGSRRLMTTMAARKIRVDVTSDNICPWCYVGKRSLEKAVASMGDEVDVTVRWHPFYLNPGWPREGEVYSAKEHLAEKYGPGTFTSMTKRLANVSKDYGLGINWGYDEENSIVFNTKQSHMLVAAAAEDGYEVQNRLISLLFKSYFEKNMNLDSQETLEAIAKEAKVSEGAIVDWKSGKFEDVVKRRTKQNYARGIHGVPHFDIWAEDSSSPVELSGGQPPEAYQHVFKSLISS